MRIVKNYKDLNVLVSSRTQSKDMINVLSKVFWSNHIKGEEDVFTNFTKIIIVEFGDNLRNLEFGCKPIMGGLLGTKPEIIKYFKEENIYLYRLDKEMGGIDVLIDKNLIDSDIVDFIELQIKLLNQ